MALVPIMLTPSWPGARETCCFQFHHCREKPCRATFGPSEQNRGILSQVFEECCDAFRLRHRRRPCCAFRRNSKKAAAPRTGAPFSRTRSTPRDLKQLPFFRKMGGRWGGGELLSGAPLGAARPSFRATQPKLESWRPCSQTIHMAYDSWHMPRAPSHMLLFSSGLRTSFRDTSRIPRKQGIPAS